MIGEEEVALWRQAEDSADALDVYLDWLLIHDPLRGELLRKRMQNSELTNDERLQESRAWVLALGLDGACDFIHCMPLPRLLSIDPEQIASLEPVLDPLPHLHVSLDFEDADIEAAFASSAMARIRALSYSASTLDKEENYQSISERRYFGKYVVAALCASPNVVQLEVLRLDDEPGSDCAQRIAAVPFVGLRDLLIDAPIGDDGVIAIASSPIVRTLQRLTLYQSEIGDAGALALVHAPQLQELTINGHRLGPTAAAALRAMPSLKQIKLTPELGGENPSNT